MSKVLNDLGSEYDTHWGNLIRTLQNRLSVGILMDAAEHKEDEHAIGEEPI